MKEEYDVVESQATIAPKKTVDETKSSFDGKFMEYIGYKLLAFIITIVTLTIAKPWADKLILDYKINHTRYNGKKLKFEGTGASLFVQRFKWYFFTIITLGIYAFWIPIKMEKWIVSNTHFEDEALTEGDSYFDGKLIQLIGVNLFMYLITLMSFGLLFPFAMCFKQKWIAKHTVINCKKIVFNGKAISLIGHYLLWYLLSIITVGIYAIWMPIKLYGWQVKNTHIKLKDEEYEKTSYLPLILGIILAVLFISILVSVIPKLELPEIFSGDKPISEIFNGFNKGSKTTVGGENIYNHNNTYDYSLDSVGGSVSENDILIEKNTIIEMPTPTKDGYKFIRWEDQNGTEVTSGYVLSSDTKFIAIWEKVASAPVENNNKPITNEKCNPGYLYEPYENVCLNSSDYASPWTDTIYDENGEVLANGIKCPDGYLISWDLEPAGECFKMVEPNY